MTDGTAQDGPQNDISAEKTVLRGMFGSFNLIADIAQTVAPSDFYRPAHEHIYLALLDVYGRTSPKISTPPSLPDVVESLTKGELLDRAGGPDYLRSLTTLTPSADKAKAAAQKIHTLAVLRRLRQAAQHIEACAEAADAESADAVADTAHAEILAATAGRATGLAPALDFGDVLESVLDEIEAPASKPPMLTGVPTGFTDLDALTGGLRPGQLVVIASRPAMGSTCLATSLLRSAAIRYGLPAALFTRDASVNEIGMRLLSAEARVALHRMRAGTLQDEDWSRLAKCMPNLADAPIYLQDDANATFTELRAHCRRLYATRDVRLIVIDTIQMLDYGTKPLGSRYEEVSEVARRLKLLALELRIPIVAVSTLNRNPELRDDKMPQLSDLRDSGALEDVADLVILIHREDAYHRESPGTGEADFIVAKHNNGPTATITTAFQGHYARFVDLAQT
ncbi:replicative DNA helicase [Streptomyces albus]|nr:replicative DNA helicase [Streptomyces albus]MDI6413144.1 replicative DNA helicase [Streptomyces albus]